MSWSTDIKKAAKNVCLVLALCLLVLLLARPGIIRFMKESLLLDFSNAMRWAAIFASMVVYLRIVKIDLFGVACLFYGFFTWLSLVANECSLYSATEFVFPCCAAALLGDAVVRKRPIHMIAAVLLVSSATSILNLWSVLAFPSGIEPAGSDYFIVGHRNWAITAILPSIISSLVIDIHHGKKFSMRSGCLVVIGYAQLVTAYSATSIASLTLALALYCMMLFPKLRPYLNLFTYLGLYILSFVSIILMRVQHIFSFIIVDILHKDITFTGRTYIWDQALQEFSTNPVLGPGKNVFTVGSQKISSAHNMALETLVQGGILGLASYFAMIVFPALNLFKTRRMLSSALLALGIGVFVLIGFSEQVRWPISFLLMGMGASWTPLEADK